MTDLLALLLIIGLLVLARVVFDAIRRLLQPPPSIAEVLHHTCGIEITAGKNKVTADLCVLKSIKRKHLQSGRTVTVYEFEAYVDER